MPVRIYDISKKLGLENKEVLSKAKELGIAAARVASSSLDKITAEYLEQQLILAYPERAAATAPPPVTQPAASPTLQAVPAKESVTVISAPVRESESPRIQEAATLTANSTGLLEREPVQPEAPAVGQAKAEMQAPEAPATEPPSAAVTEPVAKGLPPQASPPTPTPAPAPPLGPRVGD